MFLTAKIFWRTSLETCLDRHVRKRCQVYCPNIKYSVWYLDKNEPIESAFCTLITELKTMGSNIPRTVIYCQTRKQCPVLFLVFLGQSIFHGNTSKLQYRIVEMYHAGTTSRVKEHIVEIWPMARVICGSLFRQLHLVWVSIVNK